MTNRLSEPNNIDTHADLVRYINALVRDLNGNITENDATFEVMNNRQKMQNQSLTESGNIAPGQSVVLCNASASSITVSLPDPYDNIYRVFHVKKQNGNANTVTVDCVTSGATIDGDATMVLQTSSKPSIMCYSDGNNYHII